MARGRLKKEDVSLQIKLERDAKQTRSEAAGNGSRNLAVLSPRKPAALHCTWFIRVGLAGVEGLPLRKGSDVIRPGS